MAMLGDLEFGLDVRGVRGSLGGVGGYFYIWIILSGRGCDLVLDFEQGFSCFGSWLP